MFDVILSLGNALQNIFLKHVCHVESPHNFFNITSQTLQAHPKYLWDVWESMDERVSRYTKKYRMLAIVRVMRRLHILGERPRVQIQPEACHNVVIV